LDLLIGEVFRNAARFVPDRLAAAIDDATLTFGELDRRADGTARALSALDVARGDRVAAWSETSLDMLPVFAALAKIGAVFAPMNPALTSDEARATLAGARPSLLISDAPRAAEGERLGEEAGAAAVSLADLTASGGARDGGAPGNPAPSERDPHVLFFTSGSTGAPKGVVLSHRANVLRTHPGALPEPRGSMLCPYPLFHMAAWTIALQQWQARAAVVFVRSADASTICAAVERHHAERINCVPAVWRRILDRCSSLPGAAGSLRSIRLAETGTSATPVELLEAISALLPQARVRVFYGSTEAGGVACLDHDDIRRKPGSCGLPMPGVEVRVDGDGELWTRGPAAFDGYFEDPEATAVALVDGWYRTGDLADIDAEGYLTIVGRAGDVIRTGGESVVPAEVETALMTHPLVGDVAVVGLADEAFGEVVCAVVVPTEGQTPPTLEGLREHCEGRLARFKRPRRLVVVDAIPRTTATNQVQRRLLAERLAAL
jgi:acyl-CoA synthetase (AMP-forming)/AMP-acid ligase II